MAPRESTGRTAPARPKAIETPPEDRHLRVLHVMVQPVLVWDDGTELAPGPTLNVQPIPLAELAGLRDKIEADLPQLEKQAKPGSATDAQ